MSDMMDILKAMYGFDTRSVEDFVAEMGFDMSISFRLSTELGLAMT